MTEEKITKKEKPSQLFNEAVEYFEGDFENNESDSPQSTNILRDEMLQGLNQLKEVIINNPDSKFQSLNEWEKAQFRNFIEYYSSCPICRKSNFHSNLKKIYFNEKLESIKQILIRIMNIDVSKGTDFNLNFGIPCCKCYKKYFNEI